MSPKMPANVFFKFFIVSSSVMVSSSISSLPFPDAASFSALSFGKSGTFFTADVALLAPDTELVSEAAK